MTKRTREGKAAPSAGKKSSSSGEFNMKRVKGQLLFPSLALIDPAELVEADQVRRELLPRCQEGRQGQDAQRGQAHTGQRREHHRGRCIPEGREGCAARPDPARPQVVWCVPSFLCGGAEIEAKAGNTRVISQTALDHFRTALNEHKADPYSVILKRNKLPMGLLQTQPDGNGKVSLLRDNLKIKR